MSALIVVTCGSRDEAGEISKALVAQELAAGVQLIPIDSVYRWEGEIVEDSEWLLICKTTSDLYRQVEETVLRLHSYEVPPVYMLEMKEGNREYLDWIADSTDPAEKSDKYR